MAPAHPSWPGQVARQMRSQQSLHVLKGALTGGPSLSVPLFCHFKVKLLFVWERRKTLGHLFLAV